METEIYRHPIPEPSDNEVYLLRVPKFFGIEPTAWHHKTFQPPTTDHHSKGPASQTFSAYNTALTTLRWRRSPSKPSELQSNARILRWSDGSLTLQFASDAVNQYDIEGNALAHPQYNPKKPTPTSQRTKPGRPVPHYDAAHDAFTYLAAANNEVLLVTNKFTASLGVNPVADTNDEAVEQLQNALAEAAKKRNPHTEMGGLNVMDIDIDPEAEILKAQAAAKEKAKQARSREKAQERERDRANRTLGARGLRTAGELSAKDLEGGGRAQGGAKKPRPKTGLRRDWSDDEDYGGRRHNREDEYDEEDDFIAASDEEDMGEASEEEEELDEPEERPRRKEADSPKRNRAAANDAGDEEEVAANVARTKRRRVIDDDDDDE
ncbi:hypothetical protein BU16DRAFT_460545 [Lophium mytilinum]|uniref:Leo1-domain-containing protein n=1 Tax=Lophium mytilinum TaxID=390894 RepID=A0A6A6QWD4_9PEZI|nr:hypothetical protein BU16DRAFT_460545 [Lophium mytilinum]